MYIQLYFFIWIHPCDHHPNQDIENVHHQDFLGGPVVENPPSNAGDEGWIPGQGTRIPHATGQLGPWATTTEPTCHS